MAIETQTPHSNQPETNDPFEDNFAIHAGAAQRLIRPGENPAKLLPEETAPLPARNGRRAGLAIAGTVAVAGLVGGGIAVGNVVKDSIEAVTNPHNHENMQVLDSTLVTPSASNGDLISGVQNGVELLIKSHDLPEDTIALDDIIHLSQAAQAEYQEAHKQVVQPGTEFKVELLKSTNGGDIYNIDVIPEQ